MKNIYTMLLAAIALAAFPALADDEEDEPTSACPIDTTQLAENMANRFVYTALAGFNEYASYQRYATSEIAASAQHAIPAEWTCVTWSVELLLLESHVAIDGAGSAARTGLTRTSTAEFGIELIDMRQPDGGGRTHESHAEIHEYQLALSVKVFNGGTNPVVIDGVTDSHGRWHYPVRVRLLRKVAPWQRT